MQSTDIARRFDIARNFRKTQILPRRERLKSALYLRLKKRKNFNLQNGDPFDFLEIQFVAKYQKKIEGGPSGDI